MLVYDAQVPFDAAWPHLPDPVVDAPFDVTFEKVEGNAHWAAVEARQSGDRIDTMHMRVDDGKWTLMKEEDWGWSRSMPIPDGGTVRFRATGTRGDTALSDCHTWPSAQTTRCAAEALDT